MQKIVIMSLLFTLLFFSCRKENTGVNCHRLTEGMAANDVNKVKAAMTTFIETLPNSRYTEANINSLLQRISSSCGIAFKLICFNCILTLPGQTVINLSFTSGGTSITKTIYLSYTASNEIIFLNMYN